MKKMALVEFGEFARDRYPNKRYVFWTEDENLKMGDRVVVQSGDSLGLAVFNSYTEECEIRPSKWIVCKVDTTIDKREKERMEMQKELVREMEKRSKMFSNVTKYDLLAKFDPEMADLLKKFGEVSGEEIIDVEQEIKKTAMERMFKTV